MENKRLSVVLVESSPLIQAGITALLSHYSDFHIADRLADVRFLQDSISRFSPDIVILNPLMIDFKDRVMFRELLHCQDILLVAMVSSLLEESVLSQFDEVITIHDSAAQIARKLRKTQEHEDRQKTPENYDLSAREKEILVAVAKGKTNKEIADEFNLSVYTVISHRKNITQKTGIKSIAGLTVYAMLNNLISMDEI